MKETKKDKFKKISKYVMNVMAFVNAVLIGLSPIWGWNLGKITDSIAILVGLIGAYLVSGKIFEDKEEEEQKNFNEENLEEIDTEGE